MLPALPISQKPWIYMDATTSQDDLAIRLRHRTGLMGRQYIQKFVTQSRVLHNVTSEQAQKITVQMIEKLEDPDVEVKDIFTSGETHITVDGWENLSLCERRLARDIIVKRENKAKQDLVNSLANRTIIEQNNSVVVQ